MLAAPGPSQDPEFLMLVILIIIALAVIFCALRSNSCSSA